MDHFPVADHQDEITRTLKDRGRLVLAAPPGTGKSTLVPQFFTDAVKGEIAVLQPRRLAARSLAVYVSSCRNEKTGTAVGYRVRHDTCAGPATRIVYQTYGVFIRRMLKQPERNKIGLVILDEFHERTLEMDLVLAWLRNNATGMPFIVMSATLDTGELCRYLEQDAPVAVESPAHPVEITYLPPGSGEYPDRQALRALRQVLDGDTGGSVLIFMPGMREITDTAAAVKAVSAQHGYNVFPLHGSLPLPEQTRAMEAARTGRAVIISTNVAETSLTIPGVRTVIDSGYERRAAFDPSRDRNTLYRVPISAAGAAQRAGRAGREAPGRCIRLYDKMTADTMVPFLKPEITRLELSGQYLHTLGLLDTAAAGDDLCTWLTAPDPDRWNHAREILDGLGALAAEGTALSDRGRILLDRPLDPVGSALLYEADEAGMGTQMAAVLALWETHAAETAVNLADLAAEFSAAPSHRRWHDRTRKIFKDLTRLADRKSGSGKDPEILTGCFLRCLRRRLAVREENGARFLFAEGTAARLRGIKGQKNLPDALVALEVMQTAGAGQRKNNTISFYIPVEAVLIPRLIPESCGRQVICRWDEKRKRVDAVRELTVDGLVLSRKTVSPAREAPDAAAEMMAEKCLSGEIPLEDDSVQTLLNRIKLIARHCPEYGITEPDADDRHLIYLDLCRKRFAAADLNPDLLREQILAYYGTSLTAVMERLTPTRVKLASGRTGRVTYPADTPPELSARIADFIGHKGPFTVCDGRVKGLYDILAPSMRTAQKTADLDGFWTGSYLQIKAELKRRYPKHPWP